MTPTQRKNLLKLAAYLESLPEDYVHFDMRVFADHRGNCDLPMPEEAYAAKNPSAFLMNCGTVACAVGHGPAAGIRPKADEFEKWRGKLDGFDWNGYAGRTMGIWTATEAFTFLFGGLWKNTDNHHYGAAARIRYFLETGKAAYPSPAMVRKYAPFRKGSRSAKRCAIELASA